MNNDNSKPLAFNQQMHLMKYLRHLNALSRSEQIQNSVQYQFDLATTSILARTCQSIYKLFKQPLAKLAAIKLCNPYYPT